MREISEDLKNIIIEHGMFILASESQKAYNELNDLNFNPVSINIIVPRKHIFKCSHEIREWLIEIFENRFGSTFEIKTNFGGIYGLFPTSQIGDFTCDIIRTKECIWHN